MRRYFTYRALGFLLLLIAVVMGFDTVQEKFHRVGRIAHCYVSQGYDRCSGIPQRKGVRHSHQSQPAPQESLDSKLAYFIGKAKRILRDGI